MSIKHHLSNDKKLAAVYCPVVLNFANWRLAGDGALKDGQGENQESKLEAISNVFNLAPVTTVQPSVAITGLH